MKPYLTIADGEVSAIFKLMNKTNLSQSNLDNMISICLKTEPYALISTSSGDILSLGNNDNQVTAFMFSNNNKVIKAGHELPDIQDTKVMQFHGENSSFENEYRIIAGPVNKEQIYDLLE